jgi:hypothetical protein
MEDTEDMKWRVSSYSSNGGATCVAVGQAEDGMVHVCDTKDWTKAAHMFTQAEWRAFVAGVRSGEFDLDDSGRLVLYGTWCGHPPGSWRHPAGTRRHGQCSARPRPCRRTPVRPR